MTLMCMHRSPCCYVGGMTANDMDVRLQKAPPKVGMILGALRQRLKEGDDDDEEVVRKHCAVEGCGDECAAVRNEGDVDDGRAVL